MQERREYLDSIGDRQSQIENFDFEKFIFIVRRSLLWVFLFILLGGTTAYLIIRYTKPVYESSAVIKLHFENEANVLGLVADDQFQRGLHDISGEIELLKSKLFLDRAADVLDYPVAYYAYGTYLVDERYGNAPFEVSFKLHNPSYLDKNFDITLGDEGEFQLSYLKNGARITEKYAFGEEIITEDFNLLVEKTDQFSPSLSGRYYFLINSKESIIRYLEENMTVVPENLSAQTIRLSLMDFNKYKARSFISTISNLYLDYTTEKKNQTIIQKIKFLDDQIDEAEKRLREFDEYFENFTIQNKTVSLQQDLSKTIEMLNALDTQRTALNDKVKGLEMIMAQIESKERIQLSPLLVNKLPDYLREAIDEYQNLLDERQLKLNSYNEKTSVISRIDDQLTLAKNQVMELTEEYNNVLIGQLSDLTTQRNFLESNFVQLPSMGTQYNKNRRLYQQREEFLVSLRQSKMELEITKAGTVTEFAILSPASLPAMPIKPQKMMIYGVGLVSAIVLSVIFVLVRYLAHNKFTSVKEVERLTQIPILGTLPLHQPSKLAHTKLVVDNSARSPLGEALRTIRTNMEFLRPISSINVISMTSTIAGEGKTFVAVNFGAVLALSGKRVCIVDLDMRKPKVSLAFGDEPADEGISTLLIEKSELHGCLRKTSIENLHYLPAGPTPPNPSELMLTSKLDEVMEMLKGEFDFVILDTPPVGLVTDGVLAMRKADVQFYIIKADYSKRAFLSTIENVQTVNKFHNMALIFNGTSKRSTYTYGHGYGYGYGYGYFEEEDKGSILSSLRSLF